MALIFLKKHKFTGLGEQERKELLGTACATVAHLSVDSIQDLSF